MIEALNYYVHTHELTNSKKFKKRINQLTETLAKEENSRLITDFIHHQRDNLEKKLVETIAGILEK